MAALQVIIKRPSAIQDMGAMDVPCTDKTGTLTEARIHLEKHLDPQSQPSTNVLKLAYLNGFFESGLKSPLDNAILQHTAVDDRMRIDALFSGLGEAGFRAAGVVFAAMTLPFTSRALDLGFAPLPLSYFGLLALPLASSLVMVENAKQWFYRWLLPRTFT